MSKNIKYKFKMQQVVELTGISRTICYDYLRCLFQNGKPLTREEDLVEAAHYIKKINEGREREVPLEITVRKILNQEKQSVKPSFVKPTQSTLFDEIKYPMFEKNPDNVLKYLKLIFDKVNSLEIENKTLKYEKRKLKSRKQKLKEQFADSFLSKQERNVVKLFRQMNEKPERVEAV